MSVEQHNIKHVSIHNYKDEKLSSGSQCHELEASSTCGKCGKWQKKFCHSPPWREAMICRDADLEMSLNCHGFLMSYSQPFYKLAEERSTPKGIFSTRIFSDKFQLLPPVVPVINFMSSSTEMHRTAMHLLQSSLEKLTVHQTWGIWTTPEIKLWKSTTSWIFLLSVKSTTEILPVTCPCLAFRLQINSHTRKETKWKEWLLTSLHVQEIDNLLHKMKEEITSV